MALNKMLVDFRYFLSLLNPFSSKLLIHESARNLGFYVFKRDVVGRRLFKTGSLGKAFTEWLLKRYEEKGGNFIDIGANLGYYSCLFGFVAKSNGLVLSVEPEPENLFLLNENVKLNKLKNIRIFPVAVGNADGEVTLNLYKGSNRGRHSIVVTNSGRTVKVPLKRIDDLANELFSEGQRIDFMKIDVEGYEPFVIEGARATLLRTDAVAIEYSPYLLHTFGNDAGNFLRELAEQFPKISEVTEDSIHPIDLEQCLASDDQRDLIFER